MFYDDIKVNPVGRYKTYKQTFIDLTTEHQNEWSKNRNKGGNR